MQPLLSITSLIYQEFLILLFPHQLKHLNFIQKQLESICIENQEKKGFCVTENIFRSVQCEGKVGDFSLHIFIFVSILRESLLFDYKRSIQFIRVSHQRYIINYLCNE